MKDVFKFVVLVITAQFSKAFDLVRHLRLGTQLGFVGAGVGSYMIHQYPAEIYTAGERAYYVAALAIGAKSDKIPLSAGAQRRLAELIKKLQGDLTIELKRRDLGIEHGYNTWQVAQTVVALGDAVRSEAPAVERFFEKNLDRECSCWRETPQAQPHTGATGWTIFSLSRMGIKASPRALTYLLSLQAQDGWWPLYPAKPEPKSAATYATAWATLALCTQLPLQDSADPTTPKIKFAVENSLNWLEKNEIPQSARWMDYPASSPSLKSVSISGLVVHVTGQCGHSDARLHHDWLNNLPTEVSSASTTELSNTYITPIGGGLDFDRTRHYVLQWAVLATVDSYPDGTLLQRATALQWLERILTPGLASPEVRNQNWVAAELLYALSYLQAHVASPPSKK
jgi:hypothetical protein